MELNKLLHSIKRSSVELGEIIAEAKKQNEEREKTLSRSVKHLDSLYAIIDELYIHCINKQK